MKRFMRRITCVVILSVLSFVALRLSITSLPESNHVRKHANDYVDSIEIWGLEPSIGEYLWNHILAGKKHFLPDGQTLVGSKVLRGLNFTYTTGHSLYHRFVPKNLVLVFEAGSKEARDFLICNGKQLRLGNTFGVVKNQERNSSAALSIIEGDLLKATFFIHNTFTSDKVLSWPSGVETKYEFPLFTPEDADILPPRFYYCTLILFDDIDRAAFKTVISQLEACGEKCLVRNITKEAILDDPLDATGQKIQAMTDSDLTLYPMDSHGTNMLFEAMSLGSVPVIERNTSRPELTSTIGLLQQYSAPVIFVQSMERELEHVLDRERSMTEQEKIVRRATVTNWYSEFRKKMADLFVTVIKNEMQLD